MCLGFVCVCLCEAAWLVCCMFLEGRMVCPLSFGLIGWKAKRLSSYKCTLDFFGFFGVRCCLLYAESHSVEVADIPIGHVFIRMSYWLGSITSLSSEFCCNCRNSCDDCFDREGFAFLWWIFGPSKLVVVFLLPFFGRSSLWFFFFCFFGRALVFVYFRYFYVVCFSLFSFYSVGFWRNYIIFSCSHALLVWFVDLFSAIVAYRLVFFLSFVLFLFAVP